LRRQRSILPPRSGNNKKLLKLRSWAEEGDQGEYTIRKGEKEISAKFWDEGLNEKS
jgi:hypothetical protein